MFSKNIFVFGLLAILACQGVSASSITELDESRASLLELITQVKEIIVSLKKLVTGTIGDGLKTLVNLIATLTELKKKFLEQGIAAITGEIGKVLQFIQDKIKEAAALGIDIGKCLIGSNDKLNKLGADLISTLTSCVTDIVSAVLTMVNNDIKTINGIVSNIVGVPVELSKCLLSLKPISCVTGLLGKVTTLLTSLPGQIIDIVKAATDLVAALPGQLIGCVTSVTTSVKTQTEAMIKEIGTCVETAISGGRGIYIY